MRRVLLVFPTLWDAKQLAFCGERLRDRVQVVSSEPADADCPWNFDLRAYFDRLRETFPDVSGVTSTSDYPGAAVAALLARRWGRPGPAPSAILRSSHKYLSRLAQREAGPALHHRDQSPPLWPVRGSPSPPRRQEHLRNLAGSGI